ncbi:hypothetical protein KIW84_032349 [Lathyrus oleraceus]|uniref:Uncharacterized protein n=1 Tax=Pisum sativum TaxID=3888 RepID=A0A9D4XX93_PEA|nr:hypothetical protein KIW84_032349 [Pisum sativum]
MAKIFKARYFPRCYFFKANIGNNLSLVWISIWQARNALRLGCRWSIRDGSNIMAMNEPWLQGKGDGCVGSPQRKCAYDITVKYPMLPNIKQLDVRVIMELFYNATSEDILQVTLVEEVGGYESWGRVAFMIDVLCRNRNDKLWNNEHEEEAKLGMVALCNWKDWFSAQHGQESENLNRQLMKWSAPNVGWLKCNVDAGFNNQRGTTNKGWCVRDNLDRFIYQRYSLGCWYSFYYRSRSHDP